MTDSVADDDALVFRLRRGDAAAARVLYERHGTALLRFSMAVTGSRHIAEDMVHDTFVEFLRDPGRFDPGRGSVASYLFGIARHRLSRFMRSMLSPVDEDSYGTNGLGDAVHDAEHGHLDVFRDSPTAEDEVDRTRLIDKVRRAVLDLPFAHREVVALCDLEELPYATVAAILACPIGTVRSRLHRARELLAIRLVSLGVLEPDPEQAQSNRPDGGRESDRAVAARVCMELSCKGEAT